MFLKWLMDVKSLCMSPVLVSSAIVSSIKSPFLGDCPARKTVENTQIAGLKYALQSFAVVQLLQSNCFLFD